MNFDFAELWTSLRYPAIFQLVGAVLVGWAIRRWRHGFSLQPLLYFFWGAVFVLISLAVVWDDLGKPGLSCLIFLDLPIFVGIILLVAFFQVELPEELHSEHVSTIGWGGFAVILGLVSGVLSWQSDPWESLLFTVVLVGGGVIAMIKGLRDLLKEK